jgi:hypothetical protein
MNSEQMAAMMMSDLKSNDAVRYQLLREHCRLETVGRENFGGWKSLNSPQHLIPLLTFKQATWWVKRTLFLFLGQLAICLSKKAVQMI